MKNLSAKTKNNLKILLIILIVYALLVVMAALLIDGRHAELVMLGDETVQIESGSFFDDPGAYAFTQGRLFGIGRYLKVKAEGELDTNTSGSYTVTYSTKYFGKTITATRTVIVLDNEAPTIILEHTDGYTPTWMTGYEEEGYEAVDNLDGDLTAQVQRKMLDGAIVYSVTDSSGNQTAVTRELPTMARPEIQLKEGESISIPASSLYEDPGFTVTDTAGNDLSDSVMITGEVVPYTPGSYELTYTLTNSDGDTVTAVRTVEVTASASDETVTPADRTIYLTFDDGPGPYTAQLLDVLKAYNVKATFFVTNEYPGYADMIGRAYREGHSIGVHTYSHDYYTIYASEDAYLSDFNAMEEIIYEQTGAYTSLFRFPGGSSNTVSSFNPGIMSTLAADMTAMGYKYFDWNVASGDAGEITKTAQVYQNIIDGISGQSYSIVLQHDIKDFSVAAVEQVIQWGLNNGYTFEALSAASPGAHHSIAN